MFAVPKLVGGLGNQLFILNAAMGYAEKTGRKLAFATVPDNPHCPKDPLISSLFPMIPTISLIGRRVREIPTGSCHEYVDLPNSSDDVVLIGGYCQNILYFPSRYCTFWNDFFKRLPKTPLRLDFKNLCFLHVRRGDYVNNTSYEIDLIKYWRSALEQISCPVLLLSDDMAWASKELPRLFPQIQWVIPSTPLTAMETLHTMSLCGKGAICANSTLSWWGAWLNPNRFIVMPKPWTAYCSDNTMYFTGVTTCTA